MLMGEVEKDLRVQEAYINDIVKIFLIENLLNKDYLRIIMVII